MKVIAFGLSLLTFAASAANQYDVNLAVTVAGRKIASPALVVKDGETLTFIEDKQIVEVEMKEEVMEGTKGLHMKVQVFDTDETGARLVKTQSELFTIEGKRTEFQSNDLNVSVLAKPKAAIEAQ